MLDLVARFVCPSPHKRYRCLKLATSVVVSAHSEMVCAPGRPAVRFYHAHNIVHNSQ
jgi:hypothetical protein